jgi:hypothetical protein
LSRFVVCVFAALLALPELAALPVWLALPALPVAVLEPQPAPIRAIKLRRTSATNGRLFLIMLLHSVVGTVAMTAVAAKCSSPARQRGRWSAS